MMRTVHLRGQLGKKVGKQHRLDVSNPAEAIRAMEANYPGFKNFVLKLGEQGYGYRGRHGKRIMQLIQLDINAFADLYVNAEELSRCEEGSSSIYVLDCPIHGECIAIDAGDERVHIVKSAALGGSVHDLMRAVPSMLRRTLN